MTPFSNFVLQAYIIIFFVGIAKAAGYYIENLSPCLAKDLLSILDYDVKSIIFNITRPSIIALIFFRGSLPTFSGEKMAPCKLVPVSKHWLAFALRDPIRCTHGLI